MLNLLRRVMQRSQNIGRVAYRTAARDPTELPDRIDAINFQVLY